MIGTKHQYKYGAAEIVGFDAPWRREIYRPINVAPNEPWNAAINERCMATGPDDDSPRQSMAGYHSACSCCYLGITHTTALHGRNTRP